MVDPSRSRNWSRRVRAREEGEEPAPDRDAGPPLFASSLALFPRPLPSPSSLALFPPPLSSLPRPLRRQRLQSAVDLALRDPATAHHHPGAPRDVGEILQRVRVEEHEIGAIPHGHGAELPVLLELL